MFNASNTVRLFFLDVAVVSLIGTWLTGIDTVHWFVYVLPAFLVIASATGFCPGMILSSNILKFFGVKP